MSKTQDPGGEPFPEIIRHIVGSGVAGAAGIDISGQFRPEADGHYADPRNINAAFLVALSGPLHPGYGEAAAYLDEMEADPLCAPLVEFYKKGLALLPVEFQDAFEGDGPAKRVEALRAAIRAGGDVQEPLWGLFHPEASGILGANPSCEGELRARRGVKVTGPNPNPIRDVPGEVLFTSNALLTIPPAGRRYEDLDISPNLYGALEEVAREEQVFWYDHPVQIGVEPEKNEIIYGLHNLSEALAYEKKAGNAREDAELTCLLSGSVTHEGLQDILKEYIEYELEKAHNLPGLKVFLFTEADTAALIREVLVPAVERYIDGRPANPAALLRGVIGVDGQYGRHYSFLKGIAAFWRVLVDPAVRATFKIDLDQVFPQEELVRETGGTAFEHLATPLWGTDGVDSAGEPVHLGMIAGALVNERDIGTSLFTPDVPYPVPPFEGEEAVFCSKLPQALSTVSEMMTRYGDGGDGDGENACITRVHVTGGTNGIMIDALRRYRPFTPPFIGRAEDQAYILSALFSTGAGGSLRYVHKDGLIMRHDKEAFAQESIKAAAIGKIVGDYERILYFSYYARVLPWGVERVKGLVDPFTGSFVSPIPAVLVYLRLALKAASFFASGDDADCQNGRELLEVGSRRLGAALRLLAEDDGHGLRAMYEKEKAAWNLYYDALDRVEEALAAGDPFALELRKRAVALVKRTRVATGD